VHEPSANQRISATAPTTPATAEIVVGVPSCNHAATVAQVLRAAQAGLGEFLSGPSCLLVSADVRSSDATRAQVRELRAERLAPAQRLAQRWTQSLRQWFGERLGVRVERTTRETVRPEMTQRPDAPRQSRGIRM